jgi:hypothetical protein
MNNDPIGLARQAVGNQTAFMNGAERHQDHPGPEDGASDVWG